MGLGAAGYDFISALSSNDPSGLVMGAVSFGGAALSSITIATAAEVAAGASKVSLTTKTKAGACISGVTTQDSPSREALVP